MKKILILLLMLLLGWVVWAKNIAVVDNFSFVLNNFSSFNSLFPLEGKCRVKWVSGQSLIVTPECLITKPAVYIPFSKSVDLIWPFVKDIKGTYRLDQNEFFYTGAKVILDDEFENNVKRFWNQQLSWGGYMMLKWRNANVQIPLAYFAWKYFKDYSFWVSTKSLTGRDECRLTNYKLAMDKLDWLILKPREIYNFNEDLIKIPQEDYCKGKSERQYLFYAGVCGVSTQLFRNSLLNPFIRVVERRSHAHRYPKFYSPIVLGDDAAVYEWYKFLKIQNISEAPLYFKVFEKSPKEVYLVSISPQKNPYKVKVQKKNLSKLSAYVQKTVFSWENVLSNKKWTSVYYGFK